MQDWIRPIHKDTPFFMSKTNYTKIAVDKVIASDGLVYNVLLLAKGTFLSLVIDKSVHEYVELCDFLHNIEIKIFLPSHIACFCYLV